MINYLSTQSHSQKINITFNFINKVLNTSHYKFTDDIKKVKNILGNNNYPRHINNNLLDKYYHKKLNTKYQQLNTQTSENSQFFSIAFIPRQPLVGF